MADYYTQMVVAPLIPKDLVTPEVDTMLTDFNITIESGSATEFYLYSDEYSGNAWGFSETGEEVHHSEDDLVAMFQDLIKASEGRLKWISLESAHTCSKMRSDGFGGSAVLITANKVRYMGTTPWIEQQISELGE